RADAIRTALQRARDYAAALGGSVTTVSQIADSGLLSHGGEQQSASMRLAAGYTAEVGSEGSPQLDPVPQQLTAVVEARVTATVPDLAL
ncbi:MAG TPA: SIMPL domain-containing protein, partial [Jatrophihabitans sp.]